DADADPLTYTIARSPTNGVLRGSPPNVTYTPKTNYFGGDSFNFRVRDGLGSSTNATIALNITPVQDVPELRVVQQLFPPNFFYVTIIGEPYQGYSLEASTNLNDWIVIYTYTSSSSQNAISFDTSQYSSRFFRARALP